MNSTLSPASAIDETTLLGELGIVVPRQVVCPAAAAEHGARLACSEIPGPRVVLKVHRPFIAHKTEVGGVRIVANEPEAVARGIADLALRLDATEVSVSEWIEHDTGPGGEILLSLRWSRELGPLVTFGAGGTSAEVLSSVITLSPRFALNPLKEIERLPFTALVTGHRNQRPHITPQRLGELLGRCLDFARTRLDSLGIDLEINPLVASGDTLYALDVLVTPSTTTAAAPVRPIEKIGSLLHPRSVAVMGVSSSSMNAGRIIARNLAAQAGNAQRITIVKEGEREIDGIPCVATLGQLDPVDLLVLSIPAAQIPETIATAINRQRAESVIVIPGGLGEHDGSEDLESRVRATVARSRETASRGPVVNGANCLGVRSPDVDTIFLPREKWVTSGPVDAPLAIVSQSGALAVAMVTRLAPMMPRYVVSIGNQIDLTVADYLRYFEQQDDVDVFAFYVESFAAGDGGTFLEAASRLTAAGKSVILYRAGRTAAGQRATASHTAAIAGDAAVARELAAAAGVMYADSLEDFTDLVRLSLLLQDRKPRGLRLAAMSNAGFEAVAAADNHEALDLASLSPTTTAEVGELLRARRLDAIVTLTNPLDVNPLLDDASFARVAEILLGDDNVDLAVIGCVPLTGALKTLPQEIDEADSIVSRLVELRRSSSKPWIAVIDSGVLYDPMVRRLEAARVPVFRTADRAVRLLATWAVTSLHAGN